MCANELPRVIKWNWSDWQLTCDHPVPLTSACSLPRHSADVRPTDKIRLMDITNLGYWRPKAGIKGLMSLPFRSAVSKEERMRHGHWLASVLCNAGHMRRRT